MNETRKLAAILVADVVGYSRLAFADEDRTLARLRGLRSDLIDPAIAAHHGRVVKRTGDGSIVEFRSVVDAVRCAIEVQNGLIERNAGVPPERRIEFGGAAAKCAGHNGERSAFAKISRFRAQVCARRCARRRASCGRRLRLAIRPCAAAHRLVDRRAQAQGRAAAFDCGVAVREPERRSFDR
jgi:hypothetical protein